MHGPCNVDVFLVTGANNDIVQEVPMFGLRVHPSSLVHVPLLEQRVSDHLLNRRMPFELAFPTPSLPMMLFQSAVMAYSGIKVPPAESLVLLRDGG